MHKKKLILNLVNIEKEYIREGFLGTHLGKVKALRGVSCSIFKGDMLGIVGESGSGKTTLAKIICGLEHPTSGILRWTVQQERGKGHPAQMVFQNPYNSLNPKLSIKHALKEALACGKKVRIGKIKEQEIKELLSKVGLGHIDIDKFPHQFSGGQKQRIAIARSLALDPEILVCDEPVSALDISIQAQIINLLTDINREFNLTVIFIAHDIEAVSMISNEILVMKNGILVEKGETQKVIKSPESHYTKMLIEAVPKNPWL
ncbi:MAG: ABC transporter ATP-binding protein [Elusimicrobiota bacterium]